MDTQHFTNDGPDLRVRRAARTRTTRPCAASASPGMRWNRRHQPRGGHGGADRAIRTHRARRSRNHGRW